MKIAILTPTLLHWSGIDRVVEKRDLELKQKGNIVKIFTFQHEMETVPAEDVTIIPISKNPTMQRIWRLFFFIKISCVIRYVLKLRTFDKMIVYQYPMTIIANKAKKKCGKHIHYQYYDCGVAHPHLFRGLLQQTYMKLFKRFLYKSISNIDSAVSISQYLSDELYRGTGFRSKVKLLEVDKERFNEGIKPDKKDKGKLFLYVGRISPHKGLHLLIQAFNKVKEKQPNARLIIIGKNTFPQYQLELESMIKHPESVIFLGFVDDKDLPKFYATCDAYVTCSLWEGFNLPIAEVNACGKPAIAFDLCAHPEVLKNGKLVPEGDIDKFAEAMMEV